MWVTASDLSLRCKYGRVRAMRTAYTSCNREAEDGHWWFYNLPTRNDARFSVWTYLVLRPPTGRASSSTVRNWSWHCQHVCERSRLLSLYPIDVIWSIDSVHKRRLSAVNEKSYSCSTRVRVPDTGDSFSSLRFACDRIYSYVTTFNIIQDSAESAFE